MISNIAISSNSTSKSPALHNGAKMNSGYDPSMPRMKFSNINELNDLEVFKRKMIISHICKNHKLFCTYFLKVSWSNR